MKKQPKPATGSEILRQQAESQLKKKRSTVTWPISESDAMKLVHELEVHQIELEMQNEELTMARERAEIATEKYTRLYDFAPSGYFTLSSGGSILELNLVGAQMLGKERSRLINSSFGFFVSPDTQTIFLHFLEKVFAGGNKETCGITLVNNGTLPMYVHLTGKVAERSGHCHITMVDISEKMLEQEYLRQSEDRYKSLFHNNHSVMLLIDPETGDIEDANPSACQYYGWSHQEICRKKISEINTLSDEEIKQEMQKAQEEKRHLFFFRHRKANGEIRDVEVHSGPIRFGNSMLLYSVVHDITSRKLAENKLHESQELLSSIIETAKDSIFIKNASLEYIKVNKAMESLFGMAKEDILGKTDDQLFGAESGVHIEEIDKQVLDGQTIEEFPYKPVKGVMKHFHTIKVPLRDALGQITGLCGIARDVTERKQAEKRLQDIIDKNPMAIQIMDVDGYTIQTNSAHFNLFGATVKEGYSLFNDPQLMQQGFGELFDRMKNGEVVSFPDSHFNPHEVDPSFPDNPVWVKATGFPLNDSNGKPENIVMMQENITERKKAEEALRKTNAYLENLINYANAPIVVWNPKFHITRFNRAFEVLTGRTEAEVLGQSLEILFPPELAENSMALIRRTSTGERWESVEIDIQHLDKSVRTVLWNSATLFASDGITPLATIAQGQNITERKLAEESLKQSEENLNYAQEIARMGSWEFNLINNKYTWSRNNYKLVGLVPFEKEITVEFFMNMVHPDDIALLHQSIELVATKKKPVTIDLRILLSDGEIRWIQNNIVPVLDGDNLIALKGVNIDINEKKQVAEELAKLSQAVKQSPVMICITDLDGNIEYANPKTTEVTGYALDELIGKNPRIFSSGEKPKEEYRSLWETLKSGKEWHGEFHNKKKDGGLFWSAVSISPVVDNDGMITHYLSVQEDITERKKTEENLRDSENRYRSIFQGSADGIMIADKETKMILFANSAQCTMLGYTEAQLKTMNISEIHPVETFKETLAEFERQSRGGKTLAENIQCRRKNGEIFYTDINTHTIEISGQHLVIGFFRDITGRKLAEQKIHDLNTNLERKVVERTMQLAETNENLLKEIEDRRQAQEALKLSYQKWEAIISASPDGIGMVSLDGKLLFVSDKLPEMYGYTIEEKDTFIDKTIFNFIDPSDHSRLMDNIRKILEGGKDFKISEYQAINKDNSRFTVDVNSTVLFDAKGNPESILFIERDVTERKQAEEELKKISTRFALAALAGGVGVWDFDIVNNVLEWDDQMFALYGIKKQDFTGVYEAWQAALHPDDKAQGNAEIQMAIRGEKEFDTGFRVIWPDGTIHYIRAMAIIQRDGSGNAIHLTGTNWDITEQKRTESLIEQTRQNYQTFFNTIDDFLFVLDKQGNMIHTNTTVTRRLGYATEELMGKSVLMVHPAGRRDEAGRIVGEMLAGTAEFCPVPVLTKSGEYIPVETRVKHGFWNEKPAIFGVTKDVSKIKLSEEKFSKAFQSNASLMAISSMDGTFLEVNDSFEKTIGYSRDELIGKTSDNLKLFPDSNLRANLTEKIIRNIPVREVEVEVRTKSGGMRIGLFSADIISVGDEPCLLTMMVDITERKQVEEEIRKARDEADKANRAKSEFISRMSHELRTPMNSILGFAQLMDMGELKPAHRKGVHHILNSGKHLLNLINEVLDISRIEAGRLTLSPEPVQLSPVIVEMMDIVQPDAALRNQTIELENSPASQLFVMADRQRLQQVMLNLINNAVKYNHEGGSVIIKTELRQPEATGVSTVRISIHDTGTGINPEDLGKLFVPFERIGAEKTGTEGTGLGLALVKELMDAMGGSTGVESMPEEGSTFWIELPSVADMEIQTGRTKAASKHEAMTTEKAATILYIEDNISNAELVEGIIGSYRPAIRLVTSMFGKLAVGLATEHLPDLILLDLNLPDLEGIEVLANLHGDEKTTLIPVIIISADATPQQIEKLMDAGASDYLTKPLDIEMFLQVVDEWTGSGNVLI